MSKKLTRRQLEILNMIAAFNSQYGRPPTRQEMADHFGWASANAAQYHVEMLEKKGVLSRTKIKSRGLKLAPPTLEASA